MRLPEPDFVMYKALLASLNDPDMDKNVKRALGQFKNLVKKWNFYLKIELQGCLANSYGANSYDRANSYDFSGKSFNLCILIFSNF